MSGWRELQVTNIGYNQVEKVFKVKAVEAAISEANRENAQDQEKLGEGIFALDQHDIEENGEDLGKAKSESPSPLANPLEIPQILLKVFGFCSVSDLGRFRLVSRHWSTVSSPIWRRKSCIVIKGSLVGLSQTTLSKFLDYIEEPNFSNCNNPLQRFKLEDIHFCGEVSNSGNDGKGKSDEDVLTRFFRVCGPKIRYLELSNYVVVNFPQFHGALTRSTPMLESLTLKYSELMRGARHSRTFYSYGNEAVGKVKRLKIEVLDDKDYDKNVYLEFPFYWIQLFSWFPYVECLDIRCGEDNLRFDLNEMFRDIKILRGQGKLASLTQLHIYDARKPPNSDKVSDSKIRTLSATKANTTSTPNVVNNSWNVLEGLKNSELLLDALVLDLPSQHFEHMLIRKILARFGPYLTKLDVRHLLGQDTKQNSAFPFGIWLDNLEELYVTYKQCPDLSFYLNVPSLKVLSICRSECRCSYFNDFDEQLSQSAGDLEFEADDYSNVYTEDDFDNGLVEDIMEEAYTEVGELQDWERNLATNTLEINPMGNVSFVGVTVFRLAYWCIEKEVQKLTEWLPNVVKLSMPLGNATFQVVCGRWGKLRELIVLEQYLGKKCLDEEGITGIRREAVYPFYPDADQRLPNITYLKDLRVFRVKNKKCDFVGVGRWWEPCQPHLSFLTDQACHEGFLKLPYLHFLEINVKISGYTVQQLFRRIPKCILHRKVKLQRKPLSLLIQSHYESRLTRKNSISSCQQRKQRYFVTLKNFCE